MSKLCDEMNEALRRSRPACTGVRAVVRACLRFTQDQREAALFPHASAHSGSLAPHAEEIRVAKEVRTAPMNEWLRARTAKGEVPPCRGLWSRSS
ncbi:MULTISPECIES: hypothetical protein [unclassified Streptomyces]|uniref:hypothetical protein n=1 Tax=unclassified Streptomyces TaxID=2593676 RepID=UPI0037FC2AD6